MKKSKVYIVRDSEDLPITVFSTNKPVEKFIDAFKNDNPNMDIIVFF